MIAPDPFEEKMRKYERDKAMKEMAGKGVRKAGEALRIAFGGGAIMILNI